MEQSVLVDSSFYIARLRAGYDPFQDLAGFADETDFCTCGVVMLEVLRGAKAEKVRDRIRGLFETMIYVPTSNHLWEKAMALAWELDRRGRVMQVTDLVIATSALELDAAVLTFDSDFHRVPGLRVIDHLG
jgi:predicted nucleic acid-binding protein